MESLIKGLLVAAGYLFSHFLIELRDELEKKVQGETPCGKGVLVGYNALRTFFVIAYTLGAVCIVALIISFFI